FGLGAPDPAPGPPVALLLHGTSWRNKEYPQVLWQSVAAEAAAAGYQVALTWNDAVERRRAEAIAAAVGGQVWSRMALPALIDRLRGVSLTIGVDSGIGHLAAAIGIPSVGLYGASDAIRTGLKGPRAQSLAAEFACAPCLQRRCSYRGPSVSLDGETIVPACYSTLPPATVWQTAQQLIARG
ncbi:MAG: glycosyltransferase family 9 protein, partial [Pseudomonadota bacterium]